MGFCPPQNITNQHSSSGGSMVLPNSLKIAKDRASCIEEEYRIRFRVKEFIHQMGTFEGDHDAWEALSSPLMVTVGRGRNVIASKKSLKSRITAGTVRAESRNGDTLDLSSTLYCRSEDQRTFLPKLARVSVYSTKPEIRLITETEFDLADFVTFEDAPMYRVVKLPLRKYSKACSDPERCDRARTLEAREMPEDPNLVTITLGIVSEKQSVLLQKQANAKMVEDHEFSQVEEVEDKSYFRMVRLAKKHMLHSGSKYHIRFQILSFSHLVDHPEDQGAAAWAALTRSLKVVVKKGEKRLGASQRLKSRIDADGVTARAKREEDGIDVYVTLYMNRRSGRLVRKPIGLLVYATEPKQPVCMVEVDAGELVSPGDDQRVQMLELGVRPFTTDVKTKRMLAHLSSRPPAKKDQGVATLLVRVTSTQKTGRRGVVAEAAEGQDTAGRGILKEARRRGEARAAAEAAGGGGRGGSSSSRRGGGGGGGEEAEMEAARRIVTGLESAGGGGGGGGGYMV